MVLPTPATQPDHEPADPRIRDAAEALVGSLYNLGTDALNWLWETTGSRTSIAEPDLEAGPPSAEKLKTTPGEYTEGETAGDGDPDGEPRTLAEKLAALEKKVKKDNERRIDTKRAATLADKLRPKPLRHGGADAPLSHDELINAITPDDEVEWLLAQGLDVETGRKISTTSYLSGLLNPAGTLLSTGITYMIAPAVAAVFGSSWWSVGIGGAATILSPLVNSAQQSGIVTLCEHIRETEFSIVSDKAGLNDSEWPTDIAEELKGNVGQLSNSGQELNYAIDLLLLNQGVSVEEFSALESGDIKERLRSANPVMRNLLERRVQAYFQAMDAVEQPHLRLDRAEGSHGRQATGNRFQAITRTIRGPVSGVVGFGRGSPEGKPLGRAGRVALYNAITGVGIQVGASAALFFGQMALSGTDENNKQAYNSDLNLLYGKWLTPEGEARRAAGLAVREEDIDQNKLRSYIVSPEQALIKRMAAIAGDKRKDLQKNLEKFKKKAQKRRSPERAMEEADPYSFEDRVLIEAQENIIEAFKKDEERLAKFDLTGMETGMMVHLLGGSFETFQTSYICNDLKKKYGTAGEFTSQMAQRIGQIFHMVAAGSGGSAMAGRLVGAFLGGSADETDAEIGGLAALSFGLGGIGAYYQSGAINFKNLRRGILDNIAKAKKAFDADPSDKNREAYENAKQTELSVMGQIGKGMFAMYYTWTAGSAAADANKQLKAALTDLQNSTDAALKIEAVLAELRADAAAAATAPVASASA